MLQAYINRIESAVPPHEGHAESIGFLSSLIHSDEDRKKFLFIAKRLGIERRHTVLDHFFDASTAGANGAFYHRDRFPSTFERMETYRRTALPLARQALDRLEADGSLSGITHIILTSCTGFYAPGLDLDIIRHYRLDEGIHRMMIGYMGCYAAIPALRAAVNIAVSDPRARILVVNLELCTLHWRQGNISFDQLVSFLLFADGCAASLVSADPAGLRLESFSTQIIPDSADLMGWTIADDGFFMTLDARLPQCLVQGLNRSKERILDNRQAADYPYWAVHPGGRSILEGVQSEFGLTDGAMAPSYNVLRSYGNMSSPTIMFILKHFLDEDLPGGRGCAMAFGPGITIESFIFNK